MAGPVPWEGLPGVCSPGFWKLSLSLKNFSAHHLFDLSQEEKQQSQLPRELPRGVLVYWRE